MKLCMLALPPDGSMTIHFHHADAIVQPLHLSSCFERACTSPVIMARIEVCVGLEFGPDAIPAARHWRPMTEMQQERAIDGSPVIYLDALCDGPERLLGGFHAFNRTTQVLPENMLEYRCRHGTRAVVRPAPESNVLVLGVTVKPKAGISYAGSHSSSPGASHVSRATIMGIRSRCQQWPRWSSGGCSAKRPQG